MLLQDGQLERRRLPEGELIFSQGQKADNAYILASGKIAIFKMVEDKKVHLATLRPGALFGEMGVIDGAPRMASALTLAPSTLVVIPEELMGGKLAKTDPFVRGLITILMENLRNVHNAYIVRPRSVQDFHKLLLDNAEQLRHFAINAQHVEDFPALASALDGLDASIATLGEVAEKQLDRRQSSVPDDSSLL
ncbi:MAG TPA: cyclic nucleotide-binding domain-containing protein [Candidatus Sulfotelmatobacter sp.]|jgi:CRP-like cAMP-binding protein|nr:cyclic nucleotide-binding domain-containing protein [Candidatus Sulfotelmatobacter sp.]